MSAELNQGYNKTHARGVAAFPHYFVGVNSLAQLATREDRVCVINILGGESRTVTPVSHVFSGGNIVCGTMPGRGGSVMKTALGDIPVYNNIAEALEAGHRFNVAVVYVPPAGVKDAVIEAVRVNPDIKKVIILTEKVAVSQARIVRQYCQQNGVDVFGANCLGIADAHNRVRLGGALGGSNPDESLVPGSVAIFSNSGNFTTTIAVYLLTAGWGTTVSLSSGKDVYIHFAAPEFAHALHNDPRSKAAVMYIEPGGYYEREISLEKPVVACVVGRWKAKLTRACGHAGAIAGSGDDAAAKEHWFMEKFGVNDIFTPGNPVCSAKGAVVTNIAHVPAALTAVMALNNVTPDFAPRGDLSLKCWFSNNQGLALPANLDVPVVRAVSPYDAQIAALADQIGVQFARETMKDRSGASRMDPKTQVSMIHSVSILDSATRTLEENLALSLVREYPTANGAKLMNVVLNAFVNQSGSVGLAAADAAREAGNSPNTSLSAAVALVGPREVAPARGAVEALLKLFGHADIDEPGADFDFAAQMTTALADDKLKSALVANSACARGAAMLQAMQLRGATSVFVRFVEELARRAGGHVRGQVLAGAIAVHLGWRGIKRKRLSVTTVVNLPWHLRVFSTMVGAAVPAAGQGPGQFRGVSDTELMNSWSFTETAFLALMGHRPDAEQAFAFSVLLGLIITNGPGTISAQGAKGAVSADGPEAPDRVQVNKSYIGFLTHTGYAHGGNGYEAMAFLLDRFKSSGLADPGSADHGLDLKGMALAYAKEYKGYKAKAKGEGDINYYKIPCINHPVFKGKDVNYDPREVFVNELFQKRGAYNVFHAFYHELVHALFKTGVSSNVYCVNIDAVIAVILLKMLWKPYREGHYTDATLEAAAFTTFLFSRMIGSAAEIDDHTNRGRNMDTRTAASACSFTG
ncbi:MAG: CoA-binding protein [Magnetococcus sp. WYHC-3]